MKIANADSLIPKVMQINCAGRRNMACSRLEDKRIRDYIVLHCNPLSGIALHRFTRWRARSANEISVQLLRTRPSCSPPPFLIDANHQFLTIDSLSHQRISSKDLRNSRDSGTRNVPLYRSRLFDRFAKKEKKKKKKKEKKSTERISKHGERTGEITRR